jgi:hypothetical protein
MCAASPEILPGVLPSVPLPGVPLCESPFFEARLAATQLAPELERRLREFRERGVLVIDFEEPDFAALCGAIVRDLDGHHAGPHGKVQDAWRTHAGVRRIATNPAALAALEALYGRRAIPFQTLNFCRGTEQAFHSDAVHFSSVPERFLCAVWIAFEDIDADNGPLVYYPGSHRLPIYELLHLGHFRDVVDVRSGARVPHSYNDERLEPPRSHPGPRARFRQAWNRVRSVLPDPVNRW